SRTEAIHLEKLRIADDILGTPFHGRHRPIAPRDGGSDGGGLGSSPVRQGVSPRTAARQHGNRDRLRPCVSPSQSFPRGTVRNQDGFREPRRRSIVATASSLTISAGRAASKTTNRRAFARRS